MNGILLVDKAADWTSNDVVQKLRGILHEKRIGHAGTLDPMATGLMTVFIGRATRAAEFAEAESKVYLAALRLGISTDTQDITGEVLNRAEEGAVPSGEVLRDALEVFRGDILQIPPMYSALKVGGQRLYKMARRGESVERAARQIHIDRLDLLGQNEEGDWLLEVECGKGTYIRTLCHDIGEHLGCGGCLSALRRTAVGKFRVEDACTLQELSSLASEGRAEERILPTDSLFSQYGRLSVDENGEKKLRNGAPFQTSDLLSTLGEGPAYRAYSPDGEFLALVRRTGNRFYTVKNFFEPAENRQ